MLFNSSDFIIFFPVVAGLYFALPHKWRWLLLLLASYYFYMSWQVNYIVLIIASTLVDYFAAIGIHRAKKGSIRKWFLLASLAANLGILFSFKYFNFLGSNLNDLFVGLDVEFTAPFFRVALPVGISFYTFQTIAYTIDVYRGKIEPERHLGKFALYVSFFPQLVAGPIERAKNLLPQFHKHIAFDYQNVRSGLQLMAWGFFKKLVIADRAGIYCDMIFENPGEYYGIPVMLGGVLFLFQVYCDFSGYSDIAIGGAKVMGFTLMDNFRRPFHAQSFTDWWRRWHISLSTWFRDYLYIPLGGNRVAKWRWHFNMVVVFVIAGIWHGPNWTFIFWGVFHGGALVLEDITKTTRIKIDTALGLMAFPRVLKYARIAKVFIAFSFSMIFFRANTITDAFTLVKNMFTVSSNQLAPLFNSDFSYDLGLALFFILVMEAIHLQQRKGSIRDLINRQPVALRWTVYIIGVITILGFGVMRESQFIYFRF